MAQQIVRQHELRSDTPKAAIYARISTFNGQNPDVQTREIEEYCQRRGLEIFSVYVDRGVSGKKDSRPQLNRMMEDAHQRRFDVIVVARFDGSDRSLAVGTRYS
jgi:DNA invertase Pin-like site-specific DNA recombinase